MNDYLIPPLFSIKKTPILKRNNSLDEGNLIPRTKITVGESLGKKALFIEPHFDDIALSSSGLLFKFLEEGIIPTVLTVFSDYSLNTFTWRKKIKLTEEEYNKLRKLESEMAISDYLSINNYSLNYKTTKKAKKDQYKAKRLKEIFLNIEKEAKKFDILLIPLCVDHPDHKIVVKAIELSKDLIGKKEIIIYEDIPYCRNRLRYIKRIKNLQKKYFIEEFYIETEQYLEMMANFATFYRSQFDDINRIQRLAIFKEDQRNVNFETKNNGAKTEFLQRYFRVKGIK